MDGLEVKEAEVPRKPDPEPIFLEDLFDLEEFSSHTMKTLPNTQSLRGNRDAGRRSWVG